MSNEYKPTYVDNTDNSISIMESTDTISFCKTGTKINTLSAKNVAHKKTGENLNLCAFNNSNFNPVITVNNNHSDCRITTNLNVNGNVNINNNLIIPTHSETSTLLANIQGSIYYNTSENMYEGYSQTEGWQPLGGFSKTKDATIHKNLNVIGNINLTNEGMIKTTGIGSFGSITTTGSITTSGTVTANTFSGTADRATAADKIRVSSVPSSNAGYYLSMVDPSISAGTDLFTHNSLHYNPITNTLVASNFSGTIAASNVSGTVPNATRAENLGGSAASSSNYANYIVKRNGSGDFSARNITLAGDLYLNGGDIYSTTNCWIAPDGDNIYLRPGVTDVMIVQKSGRVGILTTSPEFPLHINKNIDIGTATTGVYMINNTNQYSFREYDTWPSTADVSIKCNGGVWTTNYYGFLASSDNRIKTNIVDVPDNLALEQLRSIPCRYYEYIDKIERGSDKTIGFIAQEVRAVMPMAVSKQKEIIPNVYKIINCIWTSNGDKFNMSSTDLSNVNGVKYKFYVTNESIGSDEKEIILTGNSDNTFTFDTQYTNVFCYGSEVEDFHTLDKIKLFTLNFSATQELDRIQQTHITEIASLKIEVSTLKTENQQQQTKINTLETENAELKSIIDKLKTANSFEEFKNSL